MTSRNRLSRRVFVFCAKDGSSQVKNELCLHNESADLFISSF